MLLGEKLIDGKVAMIARGFKNFANGESETDEYIIVADPETPGEVIETILLNLRNYSSVELNELKTKFAVFKVVKIIAK